MVNFDASTPQLRVVKNWVDAYLSLDAKNLEPLISKDFRYETFPEADDVSREARERHLESFRGVLSGVNKFDVRIKRWRNTFGLADRYPPSLGHLSRSD